MNRPEHDLLAEVLAEASPDGFRAASLQQTLRTVRRRRHFRQARRVAGTVMVFVLAGMLFWPKTPAPTPGLRAVTKASVVAPYRTVETTALPPTATVRSQPFGGDGLIASASTVRWIETVPGWFRPIDDDQLLALAGPRPVMLVRVGPGTERLIFADAADEPRSN